MRGVGAYTGYPHENVARVRGNLIFFYQGIPEGQDYWHPWLRWTGPVTCINLSSRARKRKENKTKIEPQHINKWNILLSYACWNWKWYFNKGYISYYKSCLLKFPLPFTNRCYFSPSYTFLKLQISVKQCWFCSLSISIFCVGTFDMFKQLLSGDYRHPKIENVNSPGWVCPHSSCWGKTLLGALLTNVCIIMMKSWPKVQLTATYATVHPMKSHLAILMEVL